MISSRKQLPARFFPSKRLGQTFLTDKNILRKISSALAETNTDIVFEIGAGSGSLTQTLSGIAKKVYTVEVDGRLCKMLRPKLKKFPNVTLMHENILKFDFDAFLKKEKITEKITVVGNIPYSITTPIIEYLFERIDSLQAIFLMVQKEVAQRLVARANTDDYGSFSCYAQYYANPRIIFTTKKTSFWPQPKIDSCLIALQPYDSRNRPPSLKPNDEAMLFTVMHACFNQRRKNLVNCLGKVVDWDKDTIKDFLSKLSIEWTSRAENISLEQFVILSNAIATATQ